MQPLNFMGVVRLLCIDTLVQVHNVRNACQNIAANNNGKLPCQCKSILTPVKTWHGKWLQQVARLKRDCLCTLPWRVGLHLTGFSRVCLLRILRFVGLYSFNCMMLLLFGVDFIVDYLILVSLMTL